MGKVSGIASLFEAGLKRDVAKAEHSFLQREVAKSIKQERVYKAAKRRHDNQVKKMMDENPGYQSMLEGPQSRWTQMALRDGRSAENEALFRQLEKDYNVTLDDDGRRALNELLDSVQASKMYGEHGVIAGERSKVLVDHLKKLSKQLRVPFMALVAMVSPDQSKASEIQQVQDRYGLNDGAILEKYLKAQKHAQMTHTNSYSQGGQSLEQPERPKGTPWEQVGDRLLGMREGLGAIPGETARLASLVPLVSPAAMLYDAVTGSDTRDKASEAMSQIADRTNQQYMSNPHYFDNNHMVYPLSGDEKWAGYGSMIGFDPLSYVGAGVTKSGPALRGFAPGLMGKVKEGVIDQSRRDFNKQALTTGGVVGVGGIAGLKMLAKDTGKGAAKTVSKTASETAPAMENGVLSYEKFHDRYFDDMLERQTYVPETGDWGVGSESAYDAAEEEISHMYGMYQLGKMQDQAFRKAALDPKIAKQIGDLFYSFDMKGIQEARKLVNSFPEDKKALYDAYLHDLIMYDDPPHLYMSSGDPYLKHYSRLDEYAQLDKPDVSHLNLDDFMQYPAKDYPPNNQSIELASPDELSR